jgi:radical SAM protein with 4Fe4S-binding SPASM domain
MQDSDWRTLHRFFRTAVCVVRSARAFPPTQESSIRSNPTERGRHSGIAESCAYYGYCGGGAPANKYYENGSFNSTETLYCRYSVQMPLDIVLSDIERALNIPT